MLFRTKLLTATCLVAAFTLMAFAPKPRLRTVSASFAIAPDSSVTATATVAVSGTLQAGDSIRYKFLKDGVVVLNRLAGLAYTASLPAPAYGQTSTYNVCVRVAYAAGTQSAEKCGTTPWTYSRPEPPPPPATIDSVWITPASVTVAPGGTVQFTKTVG